MERRTGAHVIASSLHRLGVTTIFGIVGIPVVEIADECIALGIRFIGFRNEQAASYAATAYGYLTGRPGVCLVVGGPGVLHALAGVGNAEANAWPLLLLAGSAETRLLGKGAFQELDAVRLLAMQSKGADRVYSADQVYGTLQQQYHAATLGRPGTTFVDIPADVIQAPHDTAGQIPEHRFTSRHSATPDTARIARIAAALEHAKSPLIVIGKGAAYARAEVAIRDLIDKTRIPFLPTPMGKGVVSDLHPCNAASARRTALKHADVVLVLGARLNWILHFGEPPKWNPAATFIQVDIDSGQIGQGKSSSSSSSSSSSDLSVVGDVCGVVPRLVSALGGWKYDYSSSSSSSYVASLEQAKRHNEARAAAQASTDTSPLTFAAAFATIKQVLHDLAEPENGSVVYVSEGANTMDISRSVFPVCYPRLRLDAGTHATMGVGMGYAIAAHAAYNAPAAAAASSSSSSSSSSNNSGRTERSGRKKVVCFEGDSAFGFSAMEIETMARHGMDVLVFVMNNGGIYHGDSDTREEWLAMQNRSVAQYSTASTTSTSTSTPATAAASSAAASSATAASSTARGSILRSTSLGWQVRYEQLATCCGGEGYFVQTRDELRSATRLGYVSDRVTVVNVVIASGKDEKLSFGWQASASKL